jgi:hypothetical protein
MTKLLFAIALTAFVCLYPGLSWRILKQSTQLTAHGLHVIAIKAATSTR